MTLTVETDSVELRKELDDLKQRSKKAVKRTISEFASRGPGWVKAGIREHYTVKVAEIKNAGPIKKKGGVYETADGELIDTVSLIYRGPQLPLNKFKMKPTRMPKTRERKKTMIPGAAFEGEPKVAFVRMPTKKTVTAEVVKGKTLKFGNRTFVAPGKDGIQFAFKREEGAARKPIKVLRNVSVPQMITGEAKETIQRKIAEGVQSRIEHNMSRM